VKLDMERDFFIPVFNESLVANRYDIEGSPKTDLHHNFHLLSSIAFFSK
jgi:hypothetical protein